MFRYDTIPNISKIYIVKCNGNKRIYIGSTKVLDKKLDNYKRKLINKKFRISEINNDIYKYGVKSFEIDYLCTCNYKISTIIERYYIKKYKAIKHGYNSNNASNKAREKDNNTFIPREWPGKLDYAINKVLDWLVIDMIDLDNFGKTELVTLIEIDEEIKSRYKVEARLEVLLGILYKLDLICYIKDREYDNLYYQICGVQLIELIYDYKFFIKNELGKKLIRMFSGSIDLNNIFVEIPFIKNKSKNIMATNLFKEKNIVIDLRNNKWFEY